MKLNSFTIGIVSLALAALFLAFDIFNINFMFGLTRVSIYPVIVFATIGVLLIVSYRRRQQGKRG